MLVYARKYLVYTLVNICCLNVTLLVDNILKLATLQLNNILFKSIYNRCRYVYHSFSLPLFLGSLESLLALISIRFGPSLRYIELPIELITHNVLHELAAKCPNLTHMLLDFSTGKFEMFFFLTFPKFWRKIHFPMEAR